MNNKIQLLNTISKFLYKKKIINKTVFNFRWLGKLLLAENYILVG